MPDAEPLEHNGHGPRRRPQADGDGQGRRQGDHAGTVTVVGQGRVGGQSRWAAISLGELGLQKSNPQPQTVELLA